MNVLELADAILALINSRPQTPTRQELANLIDEHYRQSWVISTASFAPSNDCVSIYYDLATDAWLALPIGHSNVEEEKRGRSG